ncbi:MAG TPA: hypothetical protein PK706_26355 [Xanthobacteraceae bacterium]|jgi:hypothetical protein|nr:hypothetical protein [Xanthobacteraceae bacterium]
MAHQIPARGSITDTTPLRLCVAAAIAFPDGSITASSLRRESLKGRLAVVRVANKDYTTLKAIEEMMGQCRVQPKEPACGSSPQRQTPARASSGSNPFGSLGMEERRLALDALHASVKMLNESSPPTSPRNTKSRESGVVIPLKSP